jgi:hypothetical protein
VRNTKSPSPCPFPRFGEEKNALLLPLGEKVGRRGMAVWAK